MIWWHKLFVLYFGASFVGVLVAVLLEWSRSRRRRKKLGTVYGGPVGNGTERGARLREASLEAERRKR